MTHGTTGVVVNLARVLVGPIAKLDAATRGFLERGELEELARVASLRDDELGRLAVNFNAMLDTDTCQVWTHHGLLRDERRPGHNRWPRC